MLELSRLRSLLNGTLPYIPGPQYTAPLPQYTAPLPQYTAPTAPLPYAAPYATMPAMSARPAGPMGYYGQGSQFPFVPNPGWMTEEQLLQQQQLLREKQEFDAWRASRAQANIQPQPQITSEGPVPAETNVDISQGSASVARARPEDQITSKAKAKRARSASTSRRSPSPKRDYPIWPCTATRPSQASPRKAEQTVTPAQDLEAFKADMTSMLSDMLQASFSKFAFQFNPSSGGQGDTAPVICNFTFTHKLFIDHLKVLDKFETSDFDLDLQVQICHESLNVCVISCEHDNF